MLLPLFSTLLPVLGAILALALAGFVLSRNWRAWTNRSFALGLTAMGLQQVALTAAGFATSADWQLTLARFALAAGAATPPSWLAFTLIFGESTWRERLLRWQPMLLFATVTLPLSWVALSTGRIVHLARLSPAGETVLGVDAWGKAFFSVYVIMLALVLLHMENLYRNSEAPNRWKIKYLVLGTFVAIGFQIVATSHALLYGFIHPLYGPLSAIGFLVGGGLMAFALVRHRLLDVDIFISRYVVYRSVTVALIGGYLFTLGVVAELLVWFQIRLDFLTGMLLAIIGGMALAVLLMSEDVRRKTQNLIHTHFYKHKYDYRVEWVEFTHRLAKAASIAEIATQTVQRILEVMWVRQAAVYVVGAFPGQMRLQHQEGFFQLPDCLEIPSTLLDTLNDQSRQILATAEARRPADRNDEIARQLFGSLPIGLVVPVVALDTLAGLLVIGPEVTGKPFGVDDWDLVTAVATQAGALMVNARLVQEASEGRELQVMTRLSAFVAHDLKNAASTLSLLADNAKLHMHKPEFQTDAIRTLAEVTGRMQRLLSALRPAHHQPSSNSIRATLTTTVETWLRDLKSQVPVRIALEARLGPTPDVVVDPDQLRTVFVNLFGNAIDAIPGEGRIAVETRADHGRAVLVVTDTGRGMAPDYVRDRLFRPFQTTKPGGLGLGLFQCRHIIQSLGGELTAHSQEGMGTQMTVRLPAASESQPEG
jgi:putative PEP-CTERM system histidine kinase